MNKKQLFYFGFFLATLIGLQSCGCAKDVVDEKPIEGTTEATKIAFKNSARGYLTGNGGEKIPEGGMVINSQLNWDELTAKMNSVNNEIQGESIDFSKQTVLAYFDQIRGSGGYTVEFASMSQINNSIQAVVKQTDSDGNDIEIMTQPYSIVIIDKTENKVEFIKQ